MTLCVGITSYLICLGYQTAQSSNVSLQVANTKLEATKKLNDARLQNNEVKQYVDTIEAQNKAYNELLVKYNNLARTHPGVRKLSPEINELQEKLLDDKSIQELQNNIDNKNELLTNDIKDLVSE